MKKLLLISLSFFLIQCSKNNDDIVINEDQVTETFLFSVDVIGNVFSENNSGHLYLTDGDGNLIVDGALINNQETSLSAEFDINKVYDATIIYWVFTQGQTYYLTDTYTDVSPNTYLLNEIERLNPNQDRLNLDLYNTGFPLEVLSHSGSFNSSGNSNNGGTFNFNSLLPASPGNYYASFKSPNDVFPRYFWIEDIDGNTDLNIDFTSLPIIDTSIVTQFPAYDLLSVNLHGFIDSDINNLPHWLLSENYQNGNNSDIKIIPTNLFDQYGFYTRYKINNINYTYKEKSQNIAQNISLPNLDLSINSTSINDFSMSTSGNYDGFRINYTLKNFDDNIFVFYYIYGKPESEVSFTKLNLFNTIFSGIAGVSVNDLIFDTASLHSYNNIDNYSDYLANLIDIYTTFSTNYISESISKSE